MIIDSWGFSKDAAGWGMTLGPADDLAQIAESTLLALADLARPWRVSFSSVAEPDAEPFLADWDPAAGSSAAYQAMVVAAIGAESAPIHSIDVELELSAYVRTEDSPEVPVRRWLRLPSQLRIWGPYAGSVPSLWLDFEHTLFAPIGPDFADNSELYGLNRPLLAAALQRWTDALGPIGERVGYARDY